MAAARRKYPENIPYAGPLLLVMLHNDEKAATKNENQIDKPGQLLAQGFKLACSVDRVGVQARATAVQCYYADKATTRGTIECSY